VKAVKIISLMLLLAVLCAGVVVTGCSSKTASLMVYCGAGMQEPMDEIAELFEAKYGIEIKYNYAGSNALLSQMELTQEGDVYMPGETYYMEVAQDKGFIDRQETVAYHIPVITVPAGNPANITCLSDLERQGVKLVWGDPQAAAIGKVGKQILEQNGIYDEVWSNVVATTPTMNELIVYIAMGQADATINWGDVVYGNEDIEVIEIPRDQNIIKTIPIGTLTFSESKKAARQFVDFCASEAGKAVFTQHGFVAYPDPRYE
jgi:molybdate transport system substrate-binding protein